MGGIVSQPNYSVEQLKDRYELKNIAQAKALQRYLDMLEIKYKYVDKIYQTLVDGHMDIASDIITKNEFLNQCDVRTPPSDIRHVYMSHRRKRYVTIFKCIIYSFGRTCISLLF
jgi:hypothetical protein